MHRALHRIVANLHRRRCLAILSAARFHDVAYVRLLSHNRDVGLPLRFVVDKLHRYRFRVQGTRAQSPQGDFQSYFYLSPLGKGKKEELKRENSRL